MERQSADKNLRLWTSVEQTDPNFTKDFKRAGGFKGTAINPTYLVKRATALWGPIGDRWGYEVEEERYDQGAPLGLFPGSDVVVYAIIHTLKLRAWYKNEQDELASVSHYGHTEFVTKLNSGSFVTDTEAPKKSLTDALGKCLSLLGFSADIFMGLYDNEAYVEEAANKASLEKADNRIEEEERQAAEYRTWLTEHAGLLTSSVSLHELNSIYKTVMRKLSVRKDEPMMKRMQEVFEKRKGELEALKK